MGGWLYDSHKARGHCWRYISDSSGCFPKGRLLGSYGPWEQYNITFKYNTAVVNPTSEAYRARRGYFPWIVEVINNSQGKNN